MRGERVWYGIMRSGKGDWGRELERLGRVIWNETRVQRQVAGSMLLSDGVYGEALVRDGVLVIASWQSSGPGP